MPGKVVGINDTIMVTIQVPELAVDDIEMLIGKVFQFLSTEKSNERLVKSLTITLHVSLYNLLPLN